MFMWRLLPVTTSHDSLYFSPSFRFWLNRWRFLWFFVASRSCACDIVEAPCLLSAELDLVDGSRASDMIKIIIFGIVSSSRRLVLLSLVRSSFCSVSTEYLTEPHDRNRWLWAANATNFEWIANHSLPSDREYVVAIALIKMVTPQLSQRCWCLTFWLGEHGRTWILKGTWVLKRHVDY